MTPLLVLRPQPGADATAARARALGLKPVVAPLFEIRAVEWAAPDPALFDAVLLTSANAARMGGSALARYHHLPVFAVGAATASAGRAAGFREIFSGEGDGAAAISLAAGQGKTRLLHLAGRDHVDARHPHAVIERRIVYASEPVGALPEKAFEAMKADAIALLHSVRAAALFATLVRDRANTTVIGLSEAVRVAAGDGWAGAFAASAPNDDALLAIAARLCDQGSGMGRGEGRA